MDNSYYCITDNLRADTVRHWGCQINKRQINNGITGRNLLFPFVCVKRSKTGATEKLFSVHINWFTMNYYEAEK